MQFDAHNAPTERREKRKRAEMALKLDEECCAIGKECFMRRFHPAIRDVLDLRWFRAGIKPTAPRRASHYHDNEARSFLFQCRWRADESLQLWPDRWLRP